MTATTTTIKPATVKPLAYSPDSIRAALLKFKGADAGPATFEAVAPLFSQTIANGGTKAELSATTARQFVFVELHNEKLKTANAKAFRAVCSLALKDWADHGKARNQDNHDERIVALCGAWCAFFKDAAPKTKAAGPSALELANAELATLKVENAALLAQLNAANAALQAVGAKVPTFTPTTAALV